MEDPDFERYDSFTLPPDNGEDVEGDTDTKPITLTEANGKKQLVGYCVVWGAVSDVRRDGFRHRFKRGSITWPDPVVCLWHHDFAHPLASTANKTLLIEEDTYGAKCTIDLDDTTDGLDCFTRVKSRLVAGMSFGGKRIAYDKTADPKVVDITSFIAPETSVTIDPAMPESTIVIADNVKELEDQKVKAAIAANQKAQQTQLAKARLTMLTAGRR